MYTKYINIYCLIVIFLCLGQSYIIYKTSLTDNNNIWFVGLISSISCFLLILSSFTPIKENIKKLLLILSLVIMPLYMCLSPYGHYNIYPYSIAETNLKLEDSLNFNLDHNDVGALAVIYKGEKYTKKPLPSNFWYFSKIRSINGLYTCK